MGNTAFRFADWYVDPLTNQISRDTEMRRLEPRVMDVLVTLCGRANMVVSAEELLREVWGSTVYSDNPVHKTITQLRAQLGDNSKVPVYIETIRKRGYRTIGEVVRQAADAGVAANPALAGRSPFRGLQAFDENDAAIFFGRRDATEQLRQTVISQSRAGRALVVVLGPSGAGKTSLVRAGLLPSLARPVAAGGIAMVSSVTLDMADVGGQELLLALASSLLDWQLGENPCFPGASGDSLAGRLRDGLETLLDELQVTLGAGSAPGSHLLLFVDRLEAIFSLARVSDAQREQFFLTLDRLARSSHIIVIIACRNDFYPSIARFPLLIADKSRGGHFDVTPPAAADIAQMIRLPAQAAGLSFGIDPHSHARLDDLLCQSASGSPDALPLLQYTLQELYRLRTGDGELRCDAFHHLGGIEGAIGQRAEEVISALTEAQRAALPRVLSMLVTLSAGDDTLASWRAPRSALRSAGERELVDALVEHRLFVSELVGDESGFGLAHEALLRRWPRVTSWISEHRELLRTRGRIALLTRRWLAEKRSADLLLPRGKQLDEALGLLQSGVVTLSADETDLIQVSAHKARWRDRIRAGVIVVIVGLAVLAGGLGVSAVAAKKIAERRGTQAEGLMGFMLGDFADKLRPIGRLDLLDSVSAKALEYLASSDSAQLNNTSLTHRAKALEVIGEVRIARGDPRAAMEALEAAQAILLQQLVALPRDGEILKQLGNNAFWQGQIRLNQNDYAQAEHLFGQYLYYSDRRYALAPDDVDAWIEQSYAHNNLGTVALKRKLPRLAAAEFLLSVDLKMRALEKRPADKTLAVELADSLSWVGATKETAGELAAALALYQRELSIAQALHAGSPQDALWANRQARALQHLAGLKLALGKASEAANDLARAQEILNQLIAKEPSNRTWQWNLALSELQLLRIASYHDAGATLPALREVSGKLAELTALDPKRADWARLDAIGRQLTAVALLARHQAGAAKAAVEEAVVRLDRLLDKNLADSHTRETLAATLLTLAEIEAASGATGAAHAACARAAGLLETEASGSADFRILDPWLKSQHCLGKDDQAAAARATLSHIGYNEHTFKLYLSNTK